MSRTRLAIHLQPGCLDVAVVTGRGVVSWRRRPASLEGDAASWLAALRPLGTELAAAAHELGADHSAATVIYRSPTQAVELASLPLRSPGSACEAATLSCLDSLPYSPAVAVCEAMVVAQDRSGPSRQTHVLVAAERNDVAAAIVDLVESAALRFVSATPLDAAVFARLIRHAVRHGADRHGWLHVGEHTSFFIVAENGSLIFHRRINLGVDSLVRSLTLPIRPRGGTAPVELDIATARAILQRHGLGKGDEVVDQRYGLTRGRLMPLVQPVLQRYVIELRQSLRFGLPESQRGEGAATTLCGPGAAVRGFSELMGAELGLRVEIDPQSVRYDEAMPGSDGGEFATALSQPRCLAGLNLVPHERAHQQASSRLKRWLWTGAAAAMAVLAIDGVRVHARLGDARREAEGLAAHAAGLEALRKTQASMIAAVGAISELEAAIDREVGAAADFRAFMQELSITAPGAVELTAVSIRREDHRCIGRIAGHVRSAPRGEDGEAGLDRFIRAMQESPLLEGVTIENVITEAIGDGHRGKRFEAAFAIVPAPGSSLLSASASPPAPAEGEPR